MITRVLGIFSKKCKVIISPPRVISDLYEFLFLGTTEDDIWTPVITLDHMAFTENENIGNTLKP